MARQCGQLLFSYERTLQEEDKERTSASGLLYGVVLLVHRCSAPSHIVMFTCCGLLRSSRCPTRCHTRPTRAHLLSCIGPFFASHAHAVMASRLHFYILTSCHLDTSRRTTGGQEEDNRRTRSGHWLAAATRTRGGFGHSVQGHGQPLWPALFS